MFSVNVFTVTFDQCNASLLNINKKHWPQTFEWYYLWKTNY